MVEIRSSDLRFTQEEATNFLLQRMGLPLSEEEVATLQHRTEGWIAGLHLAALSLRKQQDLPGWVADFAGSHRYLLDYVQQDILVRLPVPLQHFLLQTSIVTRMNAAVCQAVTAGPSQKDQKIYFSGGTDNPYNYDGIGYDGRPSEPSPVTFAWSLRTSKWEVITENTPDPTMDHRGLLVTPAGLVIIGGMEKGQQVTSRVTVIPKEAKAQ